MWKAFLASFEIWGFFFVQVVSLGGKDRVTRKQKSQALLSPSVVIVINLLSIQRNFWHPQTNKTNISINHTSWKHVYVNPKSKEILIHRFSNSKPRYAGVPRDFVKHTARLWMKEWYACKGIGKAIPLQARTGPEGSRRLRFPDFKTIGTWRW